MQMQWLKIGLMNFGCWNITAIQELTHPSCYKEKIEQIISPHMLSEIKVLLLASILRQIF